MGQAVSGLSPGDRVDRTGETTEAPFGIWFGRERRLRQISVELVSIATRIPPERICEDALAAGWMRCEIREPLEWHSVVTAVADG